MPQNVGTIKEIVLKCLEIDLMAARIYKHYLSLPISAPVKNLFHALHDDELRHIAYWRGLLKRAQGGGLIELFEDGEVLLYELTALAAAAEGIQQEALASGSRDVNGLLLSTFKLEYVLLHPAFLVLFDFADILPNRRTMEDEYEEHLDHLCGALNAQASENPMFPLAGELLRRVWRETKRLVRLNQSDVLSGALNRRGFYVQIKPLLFLARRKGYPVAVMIVDVDRFKSINDGFGHQAGDRVIRLVSEAVQNGVRQSDVVARYGGDEFIVFLLDAQTSALSEMAHKIKSVMEERTRTVAPVTVSIGIASCVMEGDPDLALERLIKAADEALYEVKREGRNSYRLRLLE